MIVIKIVILQKCYETKFNSLWKSSQKPVKMCSWHAVENEIILNSQKFRTFKIDAKQLNDSSPRFISLTWISLISSLSLIHDARLCWLPLVVLLMVAKCGSTPLGGTEVDDTTLADQYLTKFGYYQQHRNHQQPLEIYRVQEDLGFQNDYDQVSRSEHTDSDRSDAIIRLQSFFNLPLTGRLDAATRKVMQSPRCGVSDLVDSGDDQESVDVNMGERKRVKRFAFYKYSDGSPAKWELKTLSWDITRYSQQISESKQRDVIRQALGVWAKVVPVTFVENRGRDEPDINIMFGSRRHGPYNDPDFDGSTMNQNVLAHAWGPSRKAKGFSGDVHFDNDDNWTNVNTFLNVAVHELGHSMGLIHSKDETAIMFPVYRDTSELSQDDIDGIRTIYGSNARPQPATNRPQPVTSRPIQTPRPNIRSPPYKTRPPEVTYRPNERTQRPEVSTYPTDLAPDDVCSTIHVDALFEDPVSPSTYIVITGGHVHRMSSRGQLISSDTLSNAYPGVPSDIDVAFSLQSNRNIYFIKDRKMWVYKNNQLLPGSPRSVSNFPESPKFSMPITDRLGTTRLILFGDTTWWVFEESESAPRSSPLSSFVNSFPSDVMFAVRWTDNYVYAISPTSYVIIDQVRRSITHDDPKPGVPDWLRALCNCGNRSLPQVSVTVLLIITAAVNIFNTLNS